MPFFCYLLGDCFLMGLGEVPLPFLVGGEGSRRGGREWQEEEEESLVFFF